MDFTLYARPYLDRLFLAAEPDAPARLLAYAAGWAPHVSEQFLAQDFKPLSPPQAPALMDGFVKAHVRALAMSRGPEGVMVAAVHCPSLLRRDIAFEIGIGIAPDGSLAAQLQANPAHISELSLFLLSMGSLEMLNKALNRPPAPGI